VGKARIVQTQSDLPVKQTVEYVASSPLSAGGRADSSRCVCHSHRSFRRRPFMQAGLVRNEKGVPSSKYQRSAEVGWLTGVP
jgi:hypothetical protein